VAREQHQENRDGRGTGGDLRYLLSRCIRCDPADATKTLRHGSRGWKQTLESFRSDKEADLVRYHSFFLIEYILHEVNKRLEMGHDKEANAIVVLMDERSKAAAMPFWG
jgi:hypothetical protein